MPALGLFIVFIIYLALGSACIFFFIVAFKFTSKLQNKIWAIVIGILFGFLVFKFASFRNDIYERNQLSKVGSYHLTNYPNCDSCILQLKKNQTYIVLKQGHIIEQSNWHYEVGGDYMTTYLDNDKYQLGIGKFEYSK